MKKVKLMILILVITSISSTLLNKSFWPVAPYNMFSFYKSSAHKKIKIHFLNDNIITCSSNLANLLPIDFFRANYLIKKNLLNKNFINKVISGINNTSWMSFDEVHKKTDCTYSDTVKIDF